MTNQELIDLVRQKSPDDLSPEEIGELRGRLAESAELREVLFEQLQLESYLAAALGPPPVSVEDIIRRAPREAETSAASGQMILVLTASLVLLVLVSGVFLAAWLVKPPDHARPLAAKPPVVTPADGAGHKSQDETKAPSPPDGTITKPASELPAGPTVPAAKPAAPNLAPVASGKLPLTIQAEHFARGNVKIDANEWGSADLVVIRTGEQPAFAEYEMNLPAAGKFALRIRYASFDSRPLRLAINGQPQPRLVAGDQTGGHAPNSQKWFIAGEYDFQQGKNVLRLETTASFPHLDQLVIAVPEPGMPAVGQIRLPSVAEKEAPWREVLERPGDPPAFADVCFENFRTDKSLPQRDDLHRWFAPVEGRPYRVFDNRTRLGQCAAFEGLIRLKAPWRNDSALKLSLEGYDRLQLHFFSGLDGVSLIYYENDNFRWAAYNTQRKPGDPKPDKFVLSATDETRNRRSEIRFGGPLEIRHHDGEMILSRGDVVLLRAPLAKPPQDVYFEGRASFHGIAFIRTSDFPAPVGNALRGVPEGAPQPNVNEIARPADLKWIQQLKANAVLENLADGAVELRADNAPEKGFVAAPLPKLGLAEVVFEVEDATPGAGVFLGRQDGQPIEVLRFSKNTRDGRLCVSLRAYDDGRESDFAAPAERITPAATGKAWLKLLFGPGTVRWWMSADGQHWVQPDFPLIGVPGNITHVGLHHTAQTPNCRIRLKRIEVRELPEFTALAKPELREAAPALHTAPNFDEWLAQADKSKPAEADLAEWRRACATKSLSAGCAQELGWRLIDTLLDDAAARDLPLDRQLRLLDEAVLLCDQRYNELITNNLFARYAQAGLAAFEQHGVRPFTSIRRAIMTAPFTNQVNLNVRQTCEPAIRAELVQLLHLAQWEETQKFCERLRFYKQEDQLPLVEWAEFTARRNAPVRPGGEAIGRQREEWRNPYSEQLNKETYNLLAELQAILDSDALPDAARMITTLDASVVSGVAPHGPDRDLYVSLPAAVRLALRQNKDLEALLKEKFGPLAQLRIRSAIADNNLAALQLAAVQFEATEAAAEAHRWLGDRALSSGWFGRALAEYRRAETTAEAAVREELAPRIRLAAAMQGEDAGQPATREVRFGEITMSPAEFESLAAQMKTRAGSVNRTSASLTAGYAPAAPPPTTYDVQKRSRFEGPVGEEPAAELARHTKRHRADWISRQLGTAVEGDVLYVSNRFQVAAYDLNNGQLKWRGMPPPGKMMRSQEYTFTAMRPLVTARYIIARQLFGPGPVLTCFDKTSGHYVWSSERQNEFFVSDPLLVQDQLVCLTLARQDQRESVLRLTTLDPESGDVLSQQPLVELRESWWQRRCCEMTALDDAVVASLGGLTVCADLSGNVRWVRRQVLTPPEEESTWVLQNFDRPLLFERRLYVAQPGVRSIECLDPDTGHRHFSLLLPSVQRLVGIAEGKLIVQTDRDLRAYDATTGAKLWLHEAPDILYSQACGGPGGLVYCLRDVANPEKTIFRPRLVWLDPATGAPRGSAPLAGLEDADPRLGPLVPHKDRLFTFFGKGTADPTRDVIELIPKGPAEPAAATEKPDLWTRK